MRWVKPLDEEMIREICHEHALVVTLEDHQLMGGAGSAVNEFVHQQDLRVSLLNLGLPDHFIHHGKRDTLLSEAGLDADGIEQTILQRLTQLGLPSRAAIPR